MFRREQQQHRHPEDSPEQVSTVVPPTILELATAAMAGWALVAAARRDRRRPTGEQVAVRLSGLTLRLLPALPHRLAIALVRGSRSTRPPRAVRRRTAAEQTTAGAVPVVWLHRARNERGVVVYLHGGAYVLGPVAAQWRWAAELGDAASVAVAVVRYRMAPDHPHPAAVDDAVTAVAALQDDGTLVAGRWALAGDSAGGGLALATVARLREQGRDVGAAAVLVAPWVDLALDHPAIPATERDDPMLGRAWLGWAAALHAGGAALDDPLLSPLRAGLAGLPPVHLSVGTRDLFVHDVRLLRQWLARKEEAEVEYVEEPGAVHIYPTNVEAPEARRTIAAQAAFLRAHLRAAGISPGTTGSTG